MGDRVSGLMLRVFTIRASTSTETAAYYTGYLTGAPGEVPGVWSGRQAAAFGLSGTVGAAELEQLLSGHDPVSGAQLGYPLVNREPSKGGLIKAVGGYDATFSAPKSLSVLWASTGDDRLLEAHDIAVTAALGHLERFGSTTRVRRNGGRLHPETGGLTIASFRQTTSRDDDPQIHTHAVIAAKVRTRDGRWMALDAHYLKYKQRMLGGLYQSVLRSELTHRFGVKWGSIVNGQAELAGFPRELIAVFSKRSAEIDAATKAKVEAFRQREGRAPSRYERAAMEREASADTRGRKTGLAADKLAPHWKAEAAEAGWTVDRVLEEIERAAADRALSRSLSVADIIEEVSAQHSSWGRPEVVQAICDLQRPVSQMPGHRWADDIERAADRVLEHCIDLDPPDSTTSRNSDGRSVWIEPTAPRYTSPAVLAEEERILAWATDAQADKATPSTTVNRSGLDVLQADAAASVAGEDRLVLVVGPAGAGKTRMLATAVTDLDAQRRPVFGLAPTAKAARVLERDTGMRADTVAKLLHEWQRADRPPLPEFQLVRGTTLIVDEVGMISTPALHRLVSLAEVQQWRLVLVGDHRQLQAVGRGGLFAELCRSGRVDELEQLHRFANAWEAAASLQLRDGDPRALDTYELHDRIIPGGFDDQLASLANSWIDHQQRGTTVALVASTNEHVDAINHAVQAARAAAGHLDPNLAAPIGGGARVHVGDVVATRRNDRGLATTTGETVRNRETWTVTAIGPNGSLTVSRQQGSGTINLPADYVREHVRLGYAATEHGYQSDTVDHAIALVSAATTRRGLYVGATRGRDTNLLCVVTDSEDVAEARDVLDGILARDRADIPAVTQRRALLLQTHGSNATPQGARCETPAWYEQLLAQARAELTAVQSRQADHVAERQRLNNAAIAAEQQLRRVDAATVSEREALAAAARRAESARHNHAATQSRLNSGDRRTRRSARRDLGVADAQLERAESYLQRVRHRTSPSLTKYDQAVEELEKARADLGRHIAGERLMATHVQVADRQVNALESWRRWAAGIPLTVDQLRETAAALKADRGPSRVHARVLADVVGRWAKGHGLDPHPRQHVDHARSQVGSELGL